MSTPAKLGAFAATLALLFAVGALAGGAIDPDRDEPRAQHGEAADESAGAHGTGHGATEPSADPVRGLAAAENGLRLVIDDPELRRGRSEQVRYRVVDERGQVVRDFDVTHERRMHLIIARRDLTGFQHLHPEQTANGAWTVDVALDDAGSYRLFADFVAGGEPYTLAGDLRVDGPTDLRPLPAPAASAVSDGGYNVRLEAGGVEPGREAELRFTVTENGEAVHTEPYLGAGGHLVALREGDLAFLHVHPIEAGHGDAAAHDDAVAFAATFPTAGSYRLFLQFKHEGRVHTVAFTEVVE